MGKTICFLNVITVIALLTLPGCCAIPLVSIASPTPIPTTSPIPSVTPTRLPILTGRLLLQQKGSYGNQADYLGLYELQEGWGQPRKATDLGFDSSLIKNRIVTLTRDWHYIVFDPNYLLDTHTNMVVSLLSPDITATVADIRIVEASFSPDFKLLGILTDPAALYVYELSTKKVTLLLQGQCAGYTMGRVCEGISGPSWIDSDTLIFTNHIGGLPTSFDPGGIDNPEINNHLTVMTPRGEILLSSEHGQSLLAAGGTVFRMDALISDAWLDGATLRSGIYEPHEFSGLPPRKEEGPVSSTISPDGRYILREKHSGDTTQLSLIEVRKGNESLLGPTEIPGLYILPWMCVWSPDLTRLACSAEWKNQDYRRGIVVIPISQESSQIIATDDDKVGWEPIGWLPH